MKRSISPLGAAGRRDGGVAIIEFALVLPVVLLLVLGIFDVARAIQADMILVSVTREGASLASRSAGYTYQQIFNSLAATTPPLDMPDGGMMYITKVMGHGEAGGTVRNVVLEQHRWAQGWTQNHYAPRSAVWNCGDSAGSSWANDGSCGGLPSPGNASPTANAMSGKLADGDVIYVVEAYYRYSPLLGGINLGRNVTTPQVSNELHAQTIL